MDDEQSQNDHNSAAKDVSNTLTCTDPVVEEEHSLLPTEDRSHTTTAEQDMAAETADGVQQQQQNGISWWENQRQFVRLFISTRGALAILAITALQAIAMGCVLPVVPHIMVRRYEEQLQQQQHYHNHTDAFSYDSEVAFFHDIDGDDVATKAKQMAQSAAAWSNAFYSLLSVTGNPILGSLSDTRGRRVVLCWGLGLQILPAIALWLVSMSDTTAIPSVHPSWYYVAHSCTGVLNLLSLAFSALADSFPSNHHRTAAFGLVLAVYFGGVHLAPIVTLFVTNDTHVAIVSAVATVLAFAVALLCFRETLEESDSMVVADDDASRYSVNDAEQDGAAVVLLGGLWQTICRPFRDISILGRNKTLLLLATTSFLSAMVLASDTTLLVYYIENELHLSIHDFAGFMFALAIWGALVQGVLLQPLTKCFGHHGLLRFTFICGGLQNILYGTAHAKGGVFSGLLVAQFTKLNVPLFSLLAAQEAAIWEQGRMQGALFAVDALAKAIGPLWMERIYQHCTNHSDDDKNRSIFGPGFMFLCAAGVYVVGTVLLAVVPRDRDTQRRMNASGNWAGEERGNIDDGGTNELEEALLGE